MQISSLQTHLSYFKKRMPDSPWHLCQFNFPFDGYLPKGITSTKPSTDGGSKSINYCILVHPIDNLYRTSSVEKGRESITGKK